MQKKGQASIEAIIILAAVVFLLAVIASSLPSSLSSSQKLKDRQLAEQSVQDIARAADEVYLAGDGASRKVWVEIVGSADFSLSFIGSRSALDPWASRKFVSIYLSNSGDVFAISRAPMCGKWPSAIGRYQLVVAYNSSSTPHVAINDSC